MHFSLDSHFHRRGEGRFYAKKKCKEINHPVSPFREPVQKIRKFAMYPYNHTSKSRKKLIILLELNQTKKEKKE
jgi:hypothetical protein